MPRLPHKKYASLVKRYDDALLAAIEAQRKIEELLESIKPTGMQDNEWCIAIYDATWDDDRGVQFNAEYLPTLAAMLYSIAEVRGEISVSTEEGGDE